jgi:hypothetical protein
VNWKWSGKRKTWPRFKTRPLHSAGELKCTMRTSISTANAPASRDSNRKYLSLSLSLSQCTAEVPCSISISVNPTTTEKRSKLILRNATIRAFSWRKLWGLQHSKIVLKLFKDAVMNCRGYLASTALSQRKFYSPKWSRNYKVICSRHGWHESPPQSM